MILLTVEEFAFLTGRTVDSVLWGVRTHRIASIKQGQSRLIPASELPFYDEEYKHPRKHFYL